MKRLVAIIALLNVAGVTACTSNPIPGPSAGNDAGETVGRFFIYTAPALPAAAPSQGDAVRAERETETLIARGLDAERARLAPDAPPLALDPELDAIARTRSGDMADGAPLAHDDGQGHLIAAEMMRKRYGPDGVFGENILREVEINDFDPAGFAKRAVEGWMSSPGHRQNILYAGYNRAGIGVAIRGHKFYATEVFMGPHRPGIASDERPRSQR
jgi:uncharacterized protein YkwD